ncbi:IS1 family transposase [Xenorhabdus bovienii]|uniref:IS1 family transposase n=1 Tax=Xenorhabdus bovienii TaxID=40576 RepID=UPI0039BECF6A
MVALVEVNCRFCDQTTPVKKHGKGEGGHQRYYCPSCRRALFYGNIRLIRWH